MKNLFLLVCCLLAIGCGSQPEPDAKVEANRVESAKRMRESFDKVGGNYEQLTEAEKSEFVKLFGGKEEDARRAWDMMKSQNQGQGSRPPGS